MSALSGTLLTVRPLRLLLDGFGTYRAETEVDFTDVDFFALTDAALASRLVDEVLAGAAVPARPQRVRGHAAALIPAGHGVLALTTFLLAVLTAVGTV